MEEKQAKKQQKSVNLLHKVLWCSVECKQDEKALQYEARHIKDYFSHYKIQLHILSLHK